MKFSRGRAVEGDLDTPPFLCSLASAIQKKMGGCKTCTSQHGTMKFCMLIDLQKTNNFNLTVFVKNHKYRCEGWLKVEIHNKFCLNHCFI
jgi:hypothetical protein